LKNASVSGRTVTFTKGDGSTFSITTQDNNTTYGAASSSSAGLTKLYTSSGTSTDGTMDRNSITNLHKGNITNASVSGRTITFTKGDSSTFSITTQDNNNYDRLCTKYEITAKTAITAGNVVVGDSTGYFHLKTGNAFDIRYPILYAGSAIAAAANGSNNYEYSWSVLITTTQSITLTNKKPIYIKGTLSGNTFTPVSTTPLTQTEPTTADGYVYILLGFATSSTYFVKVMNNYLYQYVNGKFIQITSSEYNMDFGDEG
jgi:hypothetical protein